MDNNIDPADQSQAFLQRAQSQSTSISPSPALESGRQKTFLFFLKTSHTPDMSIKKNCESYCPILFVRGVSYKTKILSDNSLFGYAKYVYNKF